MPRFNPKDLSYDQSLPPFLAALRGQLTGDDRGADPILAGRRRAVKKRSASEEAEDAPLVVDERGDVVGGVTVGKDGAVAEDKAADKTGDETKDEKTDDTRDDANVAFGAGKKRRVGKVVGGDEYEVAERDLKRKREAKKDNSKDESVTKDKKDIIDKKDKKDKKKEKKKKIQLSFEDEEG
ncbi:hypothetical protein F503_02583 [Ophiostoma piceae UAMH 11346]|uniref:DUF4604 domain-containing protein n=1 Tax=Ophiostoma piceae (strain UAMH 11346) TaxID=1262450 RepID=S3CZP1_OPHP1|nr:hypothetical protein F503_02583 [Ophiostoma piceae UAMH 11346]